jgi:hypothetical protein
LQVVVEEQAVKLGGEIVMLARVFGRDTDRVFLVPAPQGAKQPAPQLRGLLGVERPAVEREQVQEIVDGRAVLDRQRAVHVGFAGLQIRIEHEAQRQAGLVQAHRDFGRPLAEHMKFATRIDHAQRAALDEGPEQPGEKKHALSDPIGRGVKRASVTRNS